MRSPPTVAREPFLDLQPPRVRLVGAVQKLHSFLAVRFGDDDLVAGRVVTVDLAPNELGASLKEVKHFLASASQRIGFHRLHPLADLLELFAAGDPARGLEHLAFFLFDMVLDILLEDLELCPPALVGS
jgi:hypothetical protein